MWWSLIITEQAMRMGRGSPPPETAPPKPTIGLGPCGPAAFPPVTMPCLGPGLVAQCFPMHSLLIHAAPCCATPTASGLAAVSARAKYII
jgi:hypothetical protein